jgi:hypothetical protein
VTSQIETAIAGRAEVVFRATWNATIEPAPAALVDDLAAGRAPADERLKALAPDVLKADKLLVAAIQPGDLGWIVEACELDVRARQWGPPERREAQAIEALPMAAWDAIAAVFTPVARIETVDGATVTARVRAGGLIVDPASPALIDAGAALRAVVRRNDRSGEPAKGGIQPIPWTLLAVNQRSDALLTCQMYSGYRAAIPTRGGVRTERLALVVRPHFPATKLVLQSRTVPPYPLTGYQVHVRPATDTETEPVGTTDWRGAIDLPAGDGALKIFIIKSGNQLLARLPLVPGQAEQLEAPLSDDDIRLQAEGAVAALTSRALDLVARREILAIRFRARIKERKFDEAQALLDEFRKLETRLDLGRALDAEQQQLRGADKLTQSRVDKLLAEARKLLLLKPLADDLVNSLAAELAKAKAEATTSAAAK